MEIIYIRENGTRFIELIIKDRVIVSEEKEKLEKNELNKLLEQRKNIDKKAKERFKAFITKNNL